MVALFLVFFWETSILFSIMAVPVYILTNRVQRFPFFPHSGQQFVICVLFDDSHSKRCEVISHCGFDLHFPDDQQCWTSFHVPLGHLHILFGKYLFISSAHILIGLVYLFIYLFWCWVVWDVYKCWILTPYQSYHLQIFSPIRLVVLSFCQYCLCCLV